MSSVNVPKGYSYVLAAATATACLNTYQVTNTKRAWKAAGVPYPYVYAEKAEITPCKSSIVRNARTKTRLSRPHILLVTGLKYPYLDAALGNSWVVGRVLYTLGYSTGDPERSFDLVGFSVPSANTVGLLLTSVFTTYKFVAEGL
ncbi:hypothetical protein ACEPAG_402 [Sanghuangporus baumii]